jgi:hypothetical protein
MPGDEWKQFASAISVIIFFWPGKNGFNIEPDVFEKESDTQRRCNNYLYQVTATAGIDI